MKKLNKVCHWIIIVVVIVIFVSALTSLLYYKLALVPEYIETYTDDAKVEDCYIIDKSDESDGYVVLLLYNNRTYTLRGKRIYEKCIAHINKYVSCTINRAVYRYGNENIFITDINEDTQLIF